MPALAEILDVTVDEILKGEKNDPIIKSSNPYFVKENTQQAHYILGKSIRHYSNIYLISIGILCIGIIASSLGLKLYNGFQYSSLSSSLMISLSFLIIGIMFYSNSCKEVESDIEKYNSMVDDKKVDLSKMIYKKHILFCAIYLLQVVIFICVIPLYPFRNIGYYSAFKKLYGYDSYYGRYWIDDGFCNVLSFLVYCILLCVGILIITKKVRKAKIH